MRKASGVSRLGTGQPGVHALYMPAPRLALPVPAVQFPPVFPTRRLAAFSRGSTTRPREHTTAKCSTPRLRVGKGVGGVVVVRRVGLGWGAGWGAWGGGCALSAPVPDACVCAIAGQRGAARACPRLPCRGVLQGGTSRARRCWARGHGSSGWWAPATSRWACVCRLFRRRGRMQCFMSTQWRVDPGAAPRGACGPAHRSCGCRCGRACWSPLHTVHCCTSLGCMPLGKRPERSCACLGMQVCGDAAAWGDGVVPVPSGVRVCVPM